MDRKQLEALSLDQQIAVIAHAAEAYGVDFSFAGTQRGFIPERLATGANHLAADAMPDLITASNSGVPAFLTNYVDPRIIEVFTTPNKAASILGEQKFGDWVTPTAYFPMVESVGEVSSYGDYSTNGEITANMNWPHRQSYGYQTITQWGERQLAQVAKGRIDWASQLSVGCARVMDKFQNRTYFFGIKGLDNYGLLNDPNLSAPIAPGAKAKGGFVWTNPDGSANATALEVYNDIRALFRQLVIQSGGVVEADANMKLCLSPAASTALAFTNEFGLDVSDLIKKNYPNVSIVTAVEYDTASGQLVQLIVDQVNGQETGYMAFTEKMRAHAVEVRTSNFLQKKSGGTWGAIITGPLGIAQLLGV